MTKLKDIDIDKGQRPTQDDTTFRQRDPSLPITTQKIVRILDIHMLTVYLIFNEESNVNNNKLFQKTLTI